MRVNRYNEFNKHEIIDEENIPHIKSLAKNFLDSGTLPDIEDEKELSLYKESLISDIKDIFEKTLSQYNVHCLLDEITIASKTEKNKIIISSDNSEIKLNKHKIYLTSVEVRNLIKELNRLYHNSDKVVPLKGNIKKFSEN